MCWARGLCCAPLSGRAGKRRSRGSVSSGGDGSGRAVVVGFLAVTSGGGALAPGFDVLRAHEPFWFCCRPAAAGFSSAAAGSPYPWKRAASCIQLVVGLGRAGCRAHLRGGGRVVRQGAGGAAEPMAAKVLRWAAARRGRLSTPVTAGHQLRCGGTWELALGV